VDSFDRSQILEILGIGDDCVVSKTCDTKIVRIMALKLVLQNHLN